MKRTTVMLPEATLDRLRRESLRRRTSVAEIVREAVEHHLPEPEPGKPLAFFAAGRSGSADGSENVDEHVTAAVLDRHRRRG